MGIFYTSDTHFFHNNIIKFCNRPYQNVDEMNVELISKWNSKISPNDTVYHLGDFAMKCNKTQMTDIFNQLNGKKHLIIGNHDHGDVRRLGWLSQHEMLTVKDEHHKVFLCHYPTRDWNGRFHGVYHLFGHTHNTIPNLEKACDVGVDSWDGYPVTFSEVYNRLKVQFPNNDI